MSQNKRVLSQYDNVKSEVHHYHNEFVHAYTKLRASIYLHSQKKKKEEYKLMALQSLQHVLHKGKLSGGLQKDLDDEVKKKLDDWSKIEFEDLKKIYDYLETEFSNSHFYDVTIDTESRQVIDIEATLKACGL
jgi:gamma-glutamylcysteine synthetase